MKGHFALGLTNIVPRLIYDRNLISRADLYKRARLWISPIKNKVSKL